MYHKKEQRLTREAMKTYLRERGDMVREQSLMTSHKLVTQAHQAQGKGMLQKGSGGHAKSKFVRSPLVIIPNINCQLQLNDRRIGKISSALHINKASNSFPLYFNLYYLFLEIRRKLMSPFSHYFILKQQ